MLRMMGLTMHQALYSHQCCHLEVLSMVDHLVIEASLLVQGKPCLLVTTSTTTIASQQLKIKKVLNSILNKIQMTGTIFCMGAIEWACKLVLMISIYAGYIYLNKGIIYCVHFSGQMVFVVICYSH